MRLVWLLGLVVVLCAFSAFAVTDKNITVYSFKVFDATKDVQVTWDDDTFDITPGNNVDVQIILQNEINQSIEVKVTGVLGLDVDIEKTKTITLPASTENTHRKTVVLSYFIPTDTKYTTYPYSITYRYVVPAQFTGTNTTQEIKITKDFDARVRKETIEQTDYMVNITKQLADSKEQYNVLVGELKNQTTCNKDLTDCKTELAQLRVNTNWSSEYKDKYNAQLNLTEIYKSQLDTCVADKSHMYMQSDVENYKLVAKAEQKRADDNMLFLLIVGAIGFLWYRSKQPKVGGTGEGVSLKGGTWK